MSAVGASKNPIGSISRESWIILRVGFERNIDTHTRTGVFVTKKMNSQRLPLAWPTRRTGTISFPTFPPPPFFFPPYFLYSRSIAKHNEIPSLFLFYSFLEFSSNLPSKTAALGSGCLFSLPFGSRENKLQESTRECVGRPRNNIYLQINFDTGPWLFCSGERKRNSSGLQAAQLTEKRGWLEGQACRPVKL